MTSRHNSDQQRAELDVLLATFTPRRELAFRLALMDLAEHCYGDPRWMRRVAELERTLIVEATDYVEILREAEVAEHEILANAGYTGSRF